VNGFKITFKGFGSAAVGSKMDVRKYNNIYLSSFFFLHEQRRGLEKKVKSEEDNKN